MNTRLLPMVCFVFCAWAGFCDSGKLPVRDRRILYNLDGDSCMTLKSGRKGPGPITLADLTNIVAELTGPRSQVDTLLEVLIAFRMNDAHGNEFLRTAFWRDHPEYRLGNGALDFTHEAVREHVFRLIEEAARRYDCDGVELDFQRFPTFFKAGTVEENTAKINALVGRVRQMLDTEGMKRGRRLVLAARAPSLSTSLRCPDRRGEPAVLAGVGGRMDAICAMGPGALALALTERVRLAGSSTGPAVVEYEHSPL